MDFQISALPMSRFQPLFVLDDAVLSAHNIRRVVADGRSAYPCRVSLQDSVEGEELLLLSYNHHEVDTPYRAAGPIYVRRNALQATLTTREVPTLLRRRQLSLRAYDAIGMMQAASVLQGSELEEGLSKLLAMPQVSYLHIHNAKPGCYSCRVDRA